MKRMVQQMVQQAALWAVFALQATGYAQPLDTAPEEEAPADAPKPAPEGEAPAPEGEAPAPEGEAEPKPPAATDDEPRTEPTAPEDPATDTAEEAPAAPPKSTTTPAAAGEAEPKPEAEPPPAAEAKATATTDIEAEASADTSVAGDANSQLSDDLDDGRLALGLSPGAPQVATLPGGVTPSFGAAPTRAQDWRFDFHGFLTLPLRVGIGERENALAGQKTTTLHTPPRVPGDFETFEYTAVVPDPWVQLNFSYGNPIVTATVIVAARTVTNAEGFFNPPDHIGINDAFLTFRLNPSDTTHLHLNVGGFAHRYGNMGEYDLGRYGTPLIARVGGMGATGTALFELDDIELVTEAGFHGQLTKAPVGVEPSGWNGFADPNVGTSFVAHGHAAAGYKRTAELGLHYLYTFVQDDRATPGAQPDGDIGVFGADLRFKLRRFGHLYTGFARTDADQARSVSSVIRILNTPGGPGLMEEYFGEASGGTGSLNTFGAQYDFSLGNFLRYPSKFEGQGPDIIASLFTIFTNVSSEQDEFDGINKLKYGGEAAYSMLSWLAAGARYDRVLPDVDDDTQTHAILTGRIIFRSDWASQDQVTLQYSHWLNGSGTVVKEGYPPVRDPTVVPDEHMVSLSASMWW